MDEHDRDASVDRLIRLAMRSEGSASAGVCLDGETLAAWSEGSLAARERTEAEAHASRCTRCQALLAAMARTSTADPRSASSSAMRRPALPALFRWLVPLTACAAAVALWVAGDPGALAPSPGSPAGIAEPPPEVSALPPSTHSPERQASGLADRRDGDSAERRAAAQPADPRARADASDRRRADSVAKNREQAREAPATAAPRVAGTRPAESAATSRDKLREEAVADTKAAGARESSAGVGAGAAPAAPAVPPAPDRPPPAPARQRLSQSAGFLGAGSSVMRIPSADPVNHWRIVDARIVQHSPDAGLTWTTTPTGTSDPLTAGASPSASVCWLVGANGTVLLTTDGTTWQRLVFPERVDLTGVTATDARAATVSTADGRTFATADGGASWVPREPQ